MNKIELTTAVELAYTSLKYHKVRSFLTILAIAIGISAVITINAAGKGIQRFVLGQLDVFGPDIINIETRVPSNKKSAGFDSVGISVTTLKDRDLETVLRHPNIVSAYKMVSGQEIASYQGEISKVFIMGHGYQMPEVEKFDLESGRFYTREEEDSLAQVAVLGPTVKKKLFGDEDAVEKTIYLRGRPFKVIGVMAKRGSAFFLDLDNIIILPANTMQKKLLGINYIQQILARLRDGSKVKDTTAELAEFLRLNHNITDSAHDDFAVQSTAEAAATLTTVTSGITLLLISLVCISLVVGGVGIMNIMYVSVVERTFEIGLRKSLGARNQDILRQFLGEAILITTGGGVVGIVLGALFALVIYLVATSLGLKWVYAISIQSIFLAVGFSAGIGLIFGFYPAKKAALLNPIEALRRE